MLKNVQIKIVLIFMILGVAILAFLGINFANQLEEINQVILSGEDVSNVVTIQLEKTKILTLSAIGVFIFISVLIGVFIIKAIIAPMTKIIKHAELIASGDKTGIKYLEDNKNNNEVTEITKAFGMIHDELQENLKEVSRQKKQIETILLHMTDGIVAFNMKGEVIHINNAAKDLLGIKKNETTFEKIFGKLDVDINMEKIIYLENITSTEQRISIEDKTLNLFFAPFKNESELPRRSNSSYTRYNRTCKVRYYED